MVTDSNIKGNKYSWKVCSKCKQEKMGWEFYKCKASPDGLTSWCKKCKDRYTRGRQIVFRELHPKDPKFKPPLKLTVTEDDSALTDLVDDEGNVILEGLALTKKEIHKFNELLEVVNTQELRYKKLQKLLATLFGESDEQESQ